MKGFEGKRGEVGSNGQTGQPGRSGKDGDNGLSGNDGLIVRQKSFFATYLIIVINLFTSFLLFTRRITF